MKRKQQRQQAWQQLSSQRPTANPTLTPRRSEFSAVMPHIPSFDCTDAVTDDSKTLVLNEMAALTSNIKLISEQISQKARKKKRAHELQITKLLAKAEKVSDQIANGKIVLPDPGEGAIWVLVDSGSNTNAANVDKHFPGADLKHANKSNGNIQAANGEIFGSS